MTAFLKRSRVLKAITDDSDLDFESAEKKLANARVVVLVDEAASRTAAGQAATLTAIATTMKCFGQCDLVAERDTPLTWPLPVGTGLLSAARALGANGRARLPDQMSHVVIIGSLSVDRAFQVRCWWDRWKSGVVPGWDAKPLGQSWNPLAGVFSGALAVREIFAEIRGRRDKNCKGSTISLWEPWLDASEATVGPESVYLPRKLWLVGLGHLGQGFLWNLAMVPAAGELLVLQDYQCTGPENVATGLLTRDGDIGIRKARVAANWMEQVGWKTAVVERKFTKEIALDHDDPPVVVSGLDSPDPRFDVLEAGFPYMIDAGVGHGPVDFETAQIRVLARGDAATWKKATPRSSIETLLLRNAYRSIATSDRCGAFQLAEASVAVPFVGAAIGALSLTQAMRLAGMLGAVKLLQLELASPDLTTNAGVGPPPGANLGGIPLGLVRWGATGN